MHRRASFCAYIQGCLEFMQHSDALNIAPVARDHCYRVAIWAHGIQVLYAQLMQDLLEQC